MGTLDVDVAVGTLDVAIIVGTLDVDITDRSLDVDIAVGTLDVDIAVGTLDVDVAVGTLDVDIAVGTLDVDIAVGTLDVDIAVGTLDVDIAVVSVDIHCFFSSLRNPLIQCTQSVPPYQGTNSAVARAMLPIPTDVCSMFMYPTVIWLQLFRIFDVHGEVDECDCTQELYEHCIRVCTES